MRRVIAVLLSFAILAVSSLPTVVDAASCPAPAHLLAQKASGATQAAHGGHVSIRFSGDWQTCRIECGCGCHRSLDALPHLLAPSSLSAPGWSNLVVSLPAFQSEPRSLRARVRAPSPPPPIVG